MSAVGFDAPMCLDGDFDAVQLLPPPFRSIKGVQSLSVLPRSVFANPPSPAARVALSAKSPEYVINLGLAWCHFLDWASSLGAVSFSSDLVNHYIAVVSSTKSSPSHAKVFRAAVTWVAAIFGFSRPLDHLSWKLVKGLESRYQSLGKFWVSGPDVAKLKVPAVGDEFDVAVLDFLAHSGIRPAEMCHLTSSCFVNESFSAPAWVVQALAVSCPGKPTPVGSGKGKLSVKGSAVVVPRLHTMATKFRPGGRYVDLSPIAISLVGRILSLSRSAKGAPLCPQSKSFVRGLQQVFRRYLASDPSHLPQASVYSLRRWFASRLFDLGCSSFFVMAQLGHRHWETSVVYLKTTDGLPAPWRSKFEGSFPHPFLPASAVLAGEVQEPERLSTSLKLFQGKGSMVDDLTEDWEEMADDGLW